MQTIKKTTIFACALTGLFFFYHAAYANNANWMSQIPSDRIFNQLIIPGTHNSATASIQPQSPFSLSEDDPLPVWIEAISNILPISIVRPIVAGWSKTQPYSIKKQLNNGIRYLDFRVCYFQSHLYTCHALISNRLKKPLHQIQEFIQSNPSEIVIVDLNHIYNVDNSDTENQLIHIIQNKLGNIAIPNTYHLSNTMNTLRQSKRNVIILMNLTQPITDPNAAAFAQQYVWPESNINSPWPNVTTVNDLKNKLDPEVAFRASTVSSSTSLFVLQLIQTENATQIIDGVLDPTHYPNSIAPYEAPVNALLSTWLNGYIASDGANALNIVIQDWFTQDSPIVPLAIQYDSQTLSPSLKSNDALHEKLLALQLWYKHTRLKKGL